MKYNVGDRVRIKSLDWYNENKDELGNMDCGDALMTTEKSKFCGNIVTILNVSDVINGYKIKEDNGCYNWTDEMIEGLVEEEAKPKFKVGDIIISDVFTTKDDKGWKVINVERTGYKLISVNNLDLICDMDFKNEQYYKLVEDETPKFKINDIVFVKNIGWVRITNGYWDSFANEYIYEVIGIDGKGEYVGEYDCISQSNIERQIPLESENPHTGGNKITLDEYKNNDKEWLFNKLAMSDNITALESIQDIFNHLQQSKYPKTYEECAKIMNCPITGPSGWLFNYDANIKDPHYRKIDILMGKFTRLLICRDAYWKIAGEEMGLEKSWEPDYRYKDEYYSIYYNGFGIIQCNSFQAHVFIFPTAEMRDAFYENFKELINECKELL